MYASYAQCLTISADQISETDISIMPRWYSNCLPLPIRQEPCIACCWNLVVRSLSSIDHIDTVMDACGMIILQPNAAARITRRVTSKLTEIRLGYATQLSLPFIKLMTLSQKAINFASMHMRYYKICNQILIVLQMYVLQIQIAVYFTCCYWISSSNLNSKVVFKANVVLSFSV